MKPSQPSLKRAVPKNGAAARAFATSIDQARPVPASEPAEVRELRQWAETFVPHTKQIINGSDADLLASARSGSPIVDADLLRLRYLRGQFSRTTSAEHPAVSAPGRPATKKSSSRSHEDMRQEPGAADDSHEVIEILVAACVPHPKNPRPLASDVATIKQSFVDDGGQLEPIDVRLLPNSKYQILSGETRWTAARELKWPTIKARLRECDDARAVELLALMNAKRKVLNPIHKAQMIAALVESGKSLDEAGAVYGITSTAGASNMKRLLELPAAWQDRVASGELPESFARLLLPYLDSDRLMKLFENDYVAQAKENADLDPDEEPSDSDWTNRTNLERHINWLVRENIRPIEPDHTRPFDQESIPKGLSLTNRWGYSNKPFPCLFELTPAQEAKLDIVELKVDKQLRRVATNIEHYDKLQWPFVKAAVDNAGKTSAAKTGAKADAAPKKRLTPAQDKQRQAEQREQLANRIKAWRHKLLRHAVAEEINIACNDNGSRLVLAVMANKSSAVHWWDLIQNARDGVRVERAYGQGSAWQLVAKLDSDELETTVASLATQLLSLEARDAKYPVLEHELIEAYATDLGVNLALAWMGLQGKAGPPHHALLEEFFLLHSKEQLITLGEELGVHLREAKTRDVMVKLLCTRDRVLPLPKSIAPLSAPAKPKPKGKGKK